MFTHLFSYTAKNAVSLLHFVQSCDGVYRKLRYLRASVGNSTLIDSVLENIVSCSRPNSFFSFPLPTQRIIVRADLTFIRYSSMVFSSSSLRS